MVVLRSIFHVFVLVYSFTKFSSCLYEDQIGKFDWKQSYIGKIKFAAFDSVKRLIVGSENNNVLAAINLKNGQIIWRHVLEDVSSDSRLHLLHMGKEVVSVSSSDGGVFYIRGWDSNNGVLLWEWMMITENREASWVVNKERLLHIVPVENSHLEVTDYEVQTGKNKGSTLRISALWLTNISNCATTETYFVCITSNDNSGVLYYTNLADDRNSNLVYKKSISSLIGDASGKVELFHFKYTQPAVILKRNSEQKLLVFQDSDVNVLPYNLESGTVMVPNGDQVVLINLEFLREENVLRTNMLEVDGKLQSMESEYTISAGQPIILCGICRGTACRILFETEDDAIHLLQLPAGKVLWSREEALSKIVGFEFIDLPVSDLEASIKREFSTSGSDIFSMLYKRLMTQGRQLSSFLTGTQAKDSGLVRDEFGLHKLIILMTEVGKLFALDTLTGEIVWSIHLLNIKSFDVLSKKITFMYLIRNSRYPPLVAQCLVVARDGDSGNGVLYRFDPISGKSENGLIKLPFQIKQVMLSPHEDENHLKHLIMISIDNSIHVYPKDAKNNVEKYINSTFLFNVDIKDNTVTGYIFQHFFPHGENRKIIPTWRLNLDPSTIVAVEVRPYTERVHSQGRVLADRSVLYKYVNPNLIAIATLSDDSLHKHVLGIYLVDGVTGLVIYSTNHKRARGPVHLVHSENWIVYSFFNERYRRMEFVALELYEGARQSNSTVFSSLALSQLPHIETLAYIFPGNPLSMVATLTERGITNKHLLVVLSSEVVVEIPWMYLEPRGSNILSGPDEGVIPYMPELPLHPEMFVNYNQSLARIRGIAVSPARLESTSLVLVYGLDLFYTRVTPSKTFDMLKEDFDYWLIVVVLVGLLVSSYITKQLASRKALKQVWK